MNIQSYINSIENALEIGTLIQEYVLNPDIGVSRRVIVEQKETIKARICELTERIYDNTSFLIALFVYRGISKRRMYQSKLNNEWANRFGVVNSCFFLVNDCFTKIQINKNLANDDNGIVSEIISLVITLFKNQEIANESFFPEISIENYYKRVAFISRKNEDMNSYTISQKTVQDCLIRSRIEDNSIMQDAIAELSLSGYILKENFSDISLSIMRRDLLFDDVKVIALSDFEAIKEKEFIRMFEVKKVKDPLDNESQLVFSFEHKGNIYISQIMLETTQQIIEKTRAWGKYENIAMYYLDVNRNENIAARYSRLLTYKIIDVLICNDYIVPWEDKKKMHPRVEIKVKQGNSNGKGKINEIGDYDVIFYSEQKHILYLVEYKNYQMLVSKEKDLSADINRVEREKTPKRVFGRQQYVEDNLKEFISEVFFDEIDYSKIRNVKSIILTTKPCFYFFVNPSQEYEYVDWMEFKEKIENKSY